MNCNVYKPFGVLQFRRLRGGFSLLLFEDTVDTSLKTPSKKNTIRYRLAQKSILHIYYIICTLNGLYTKKNHIEHPPREVEVDNYLKAKLCLVIFEELFRGTAHGIFSRPDKGRVPVSQS